MEQSQEISGKAIEYAVLAELADAHGSGPCGKPWGFESLRPHQQKQTGLACLFCYMRNRIERFESNVHFAYAARDSTERRLFFYLC